jgi:hypothetical protein
MATLIALPVGQAQSSEPMCPHRDLIRTECYADFLRLQGIESGYRMKIRSEGPTRMIVSVMHGGVPDELDEPVTAGITRLYPHRRRVFEFARRSTLGESGFSSHRALADALGYLDAKAKERLERRKGIGLDPTGRLAVADRDCLASIVALRRERCLHPDFSSHAGRGGACR